MVRACCKPRSLINCGHAKQPRTPTLRRLSLLHSPKNCQEESQENWKISCIYYKDTQYVYASKQYTFFCILNTQRLLFSYENSQKTFLVVWEWSKLLWIWSQYSILYLCWHFWHVRWYCLAYVSFRCCGRCEKHKVFCRIVRKLKKELSKEAVRFNELL